MIRVAKGLLWHVLGLQGNHRAIPGNVTCNDGLLTSWGLREGLPESSILIGIRRKIGQDLCRKVATAVAMKIGRRLGCFSSRSTWRKNSSLVCPDLYSSFQGWTCGIRAAVTQSLLASLGFSCGFAGSFNAPASRPFAALGNTKRGATRGTFWG